MIEKVNGFKTYIGVITTIVGMTGLAKYITPEQATAIASQSLEIAGIILTVIGAFHKDMKIADAEEALL